VGLVNPAAVEFRGSRILILNWRDLQHPDAGGAEQYIHEIASRWAAAGTDVTWFTSQAPGQPPRTTIDGIRIFRAGGTLSVYARTAARLVRTRGHFDAVVDCQNGVPFFAPIFAGGDMPVVQVVHHVHQDQFATRFSPPMAAFGRLLEGRVARRVYGDRAIATVSPSTRTELRSRLGFHGPIYVVPNGTVPVRDLGTARSPFPTITLVSRLVPHKQVDLLLGHLATVADQIAGLQVEIVGDGPERDRLRGLVADLGLQSTVHFHGRVSDRRRDELLGRAWLTTSTSAAEGWGCTIVEAAACGVPCLALRAPGVQDSVLDGETGWLVDRPADFGHALVAAIEHLRDRKRAATTAADCRAWAACFSWDRSADLLAGVVIEEMRALAARREGRASDRRSARSDMSALVDFPTQPRTELRTVLRSTDEVVEGGDRTSVVLNGCDEYDASVVLARLGVRDGSPRLADHRLLLAGPEAPPTHGIRGLPEAKVRSA
jgi:glycosyltransferase involved in cell wall biosynthesis